MGVARLSNLATKWPYPKPREGEKHLNSGRNGFGLRIFTVRTMVFSLLLLVAGAQRLWADDRSDCQHRVDKAEKSYDDALRHHSAGSHEVLERQQELNAERENCWNRNHSWWNGKEQRWHEQRDWDRDEHHDHDRDHDRDHDHDQNH